MLDMLAPNFSRAEMACRCGCGLDHMDEKFMMMLQQLRNKLGPLPISSGVRCEKHNHDSGGYPKSAHLQSKGADIKIFGPRALELWGTFSQEPQTLVCVQDYPCSANIIKLRITKIDILLA